MRLLDVTHEDDFKKHLDIFEGRIPWLYLDGANPANVTVGVGCVISSASYSESLNWDGGMASVALAAPEWQAVKNSTPGLMAAAYAHLTTLRLPDEEIDRLRDRRIDMMESDLMAEIKGVRGLPQTALCAVLDMGWNLGIAKLYRDFFRPPKTNGPDDPGSKFGPALYAGDWATAAAESERRGIQQSRNDYVRDLILSCVATPVS